MKLSPKQQRFCDEYLIDLNATQAAIRAGYSPKTAAQQAARLLTNVKIQEYIQAKRQKTANKMDITRDRILEELSLIAFGDAKALFDQEGNLRKIHEMPDNVSRSIASVEVDEISEYDHGRKVPVGLTKKIKLWDKLRAIEQISKILGYNAPEKVEGTVTVNWQETKTYDPNDKTNPGA